MTSQLIILVVLILLSGFFSGAEVALLSLSKIRVRTLRKEYKKGSTILSKLKSDQRKMIITILIGNNVVNIVAASMATLLATKRFGSAGVGIVTGILTLVILIFGEIIPKTFASKYATPISLLIARPILILEYILTPIIYILKWFTKFVEQIVKAKTHDPISEAEILTMIEYGVEKKVVNREEQFIINRALKFGDIAAREVMIPLKDVVSLESNASLTYSMDTIFNSGFTRVPVYEGEKHNIVGIALAKEVAKHLTQNGKKKGIGEIAKDPLFVSDQIRIDDLFRLFQSRRFHMAIVRRKHKALGVVTLEDLIEELMGEIEDESDVQ